MKKNKTEDKNSVENSAKSRTRGLKPFKKGQSGNPKGHPKGQRNFLTIYKEALKSLATRNNMTELELENEILEKGILNARRGEYRFYKDIQDRLHGMANQSIDLTTGGKELPAPIIRVTRK